MKSIIAKSIRDALIEIDWLDPELKSRSAGLVIKTTKQVKQGDGFVNVTFPITNDLEGKKCYESGDYYAMLPNANYASVMYIEAPNPIIFQYDEQRRQMVYSDTMRLVIWGNMKKVGSNDLNAVDRIVYQITKELTASPGNRGVDSGCIDVTDDRITGGKIDIVINGIEVNNPAIFSEYSWVDKTQAFTYPYQYARFTLQTYLRLGLNCLEDLELGENELC